MSGEITGPPDVNFYGMLSGLGNTLRQSRIDARDQQLRDTFKDGIPKAPDGSIDFNAIGDRLSQSGAPVDTLLNVAQLGEKQRLERAQLTASADFRDALGGILGGGKAGAPPETPSPQPVVQPVIQPPVANNKPTPGAPGGAFGGLGFKPVGWDESEPAPTNVASNAPVAPQPAIAAPLPPQQPQAPAPIVPEKGVDLSDKIPALVAASANPRLPQQDRELAKTLLQQAFAAQKEGETISQYRFAVQQGFRGSLMDFTKANKGPAVNIDQRAESEQNKAVGKALGEAQAADILAGDRAAQKLRQLATLDNANKVGGDNISSGPFAKTILAGKQGLAELAGVDLKGLPESEVIQKIGFGLATNITKAISQRPSQMEFMKALENVPGLFQSKPGRVALTSILTQEARAEQDLGRLAARHKTVENGPVWQEVKDKYYDEHPLISPFTGKPFSPNDVQMIVGSVPKEAGSAAAPSGLTRADVEAEIRRRQGGQ